MKERAIGEKFVRKFKVLEITKFSNCFSCYFVDKKRYKCHNRKCGGQISPRADGKSVMYKNITNSLTDCEKLLLERGLLKNIL